MVFEYTNWHDASDAMDIATASEDVARVGSAFVAGFLWLVKVEVDGPNFVAEKRARVLALLGPDLEVKWEMQNAYSVRGKRERVGR